jgi:hypothetical protein
MKTLTLALALMVAAIAAPASAAPDKNGTPTTIPVGGIVNLSATDATTGTPFNGTFTLTRFANQNGALVAIGTITGAVTDPQTGKTSSFLQTVAIPARASTTAATAGAAATPGVATPGAVTAAAAAACSILHLDLGPLTLNVLGLNVHLNEVVLDITAIPGAGNLLGNLLCSVAGLLDNPNALANLLNQILALL